MTPRSDVRLWALLCLLIFAGAAVSATVKPEQPNIIYIMADDLGYGDLGCYGQQKIKTPHLDKLAKEGMRFTQFYAGAPVCAPSRCVLMTGKHMGHARVRGNSGKENPMPQTVRTEDVTVAEVLKQAGYTTALIGKWGLSEENSIGHPNKKGFDHFFGYLNQHHAHNYYPEFLLRNDSRVYLENIVPGEGDYGQGWATVKKQYSHDLMAEEALSWVEANKSKPFFLYLAFTLPHANNEGTRGTGNGQEIPALGQYENLDWKPQDKGQAAMVTRLDADVGRLMDKLKKLGIDKKTLVIFTSDNGNHKEGGNDPDFFDANGPLRGMKRDLYEGGIRVPFIARWPGKIKGGSTTEHIGYFGDFMATVADLSGGKAPEGLDSISFVPTLLGKNQEQKQHEYLYWEFYEQGGKTAVRAGNWKAVR
ncbi:MAG: arylsulfatase, partial [Verrucomicrobia bacterium]|nr:arylsulfatase [Verrucomicrobiota bacterium]